MQDFNVLFKENMFVYAAENATNPQRLKVTIPEILLDKPTGEARENRIPKGNINIFINENPPALQTTTISRNFIELPVIGSFNGSYYVHGDRYNLNAGIGTIHVGDRLIASFIGNCPTNGIIIARC